MKSKNTLGMLIIAAALVGGAVLISIRDEQSFTEARVPTRKIETKITSGTVEKIEIQSPGSAPVTLYKKNDQWFTHPEKNHIANSSAITSIFTPFDRELEGTILSERPESFKDYEVSEDTATRVKFYGAGKSEPILDLFVGKNGPVAFSTYVREAGKSEVLNLNTGISTTFKRPDGWRDKKVFNFSANQSTRIEAEGTSSSYVLAKKDGKWFFEKPELGEAQEVRVSSIASMFSGYNTGSFPETTATLAELGLQPAQQKITVAYDDTATSPAQSKKLTLLIGNKIGTTDDHYAKREDNEDIYTIPASLVEGLIPADLGSLAVNPPTPDTQPNDEATKQTETAETTGTETITPDPAPATQSSEAETSATQAAPPAPIPPSTPEDPATTETVTADNEPAATAVTDESTTSPQN